MTPSAVGARAEAEIALHLLRAGKHVYLPIWASHSRVDLLVIDDAGVHRVQCKTARLMNDTIVFSTCSNTSGRRKDYRGEVDFFGVYAPELDRVFLVPVADVPGRGATLRLSPPRNGQTRGVRWARDYVVGRT